MLQVMVLQVMVLQVTSSELVIEEPPTTPTTPSMQSSTQ
jgi:hypothetical protein